MRTFCVICFDSLYLLIPFGRHPLALLSSQIVIFIFPTDEVGRGHRNVERPSVHPCVHASVLPGFPIIIWNSNNSINFWFGLCICWVSVQNWFAFWAMLAQFWPSSVQNKDWKWVKMVVSNHYLRKYSDNPIQTWCVHLLGACSELLRFWATLVQIWPSGGRKMT